ncbi:MAG: enoyl-CoA hydratase [Gammaproteobacteria bacterium]|nr:enoyl-CoA hydratase [Gammaproteobacteria bacterium]
MSDLVEFNLSEGVADIRFNRPDKHNSLSLEMFEAVIAAGERVHREAGIRAAVVSGNGASFCAGLDLGLMQSWLEDDEAAARTQQRLLSRDAGPDNIAQRAAYVWKSAPVPVIGALHGNVFGGGMQIALGCDIRIAAPDARLSIMETRYGLIPDMSITATLPDLVARDVALELTLSARVFGAEEALGLGLVTRLEAEPHAAALALAATIAGRSPHAVRAVKELYNQAWRAEADKGMRLEEALQIPLIGSPNQVEAVAAAVAKRAPRFADPAT